MRAAIVCIIAVLPACSLDRPIFTPPGETGSSSPDAGLAFDGPSAMDGPPPADAATPPSPVPDAELPADGPVDAMLPDAPPPPDGRPPFGYDIGYVDDLTVGSSVGGASSLLLVVDTGVAALDLSTATVLATSVDSATIRWNLVAAPVAFRLASGHAAGKLSAPAAEQIVTGGVVREPIDERTLNFTMTFDSIPAGTTLHAEAVISIEGNTVPLAFTLHGVAGSVALFNSAQRRSADPGP